MDERMRMTTAKRSLDVVLHLLPSAARDLREIMRYALTFYGATKEEGSQFAHQEVLFTKFYDAVDAMRRDRWRLADKYFQELISECEDVRAKVDQDLVNEEIKNTRKALNCKERLPAGEGHDDKEK